MRGKEWTSQAHRASPQRLTDPGPLLSVWHRVWCWDHSWREGDESLDEGARREAAWEGPVFLASSEEKDVSVSCVLWGRHFPRGGLLKGKTSTGEEVKTDRAFLGATNGDIGLLWSICDGDVLVMVDGGGAILEHPGIKHFS